MSVLRLDFRVGMGLVVRYQDRIEHRFEIIDITRNHITFRHEGGISVHDEHGTVLPTGEVRVPMASHIELDVAGDVAIFNFRSSASIRCEILMDADHTFQFKRVQ